MNKSKLIISLLSLDFIFLGFWVFSGDLSLLEGIKSIGTTRYTWGVFADLSFGLALMGVLSFLIEKNWKKSLIWTLSFFLLGNIGTAIYLLLRFDYLKEKLSK